MNQRKKIMMGLWVLTLLTCLILPFDAPITLDSTSLPPSFQHPFGTDLLGRDLLLRILSAFKISLLVGFGASSLALVFALLFVLCSELSSPKLGLRILQIFLALPPLLFVMFLQSITQGGLSAMIFILALGHFSAIAFVLQSEIVKIKQQDFYQNALILGTSPLKALQSEILPVCLPLLLILWVSNIAHAIASEATLSFFGLGIEPSKASLGNILSDCSKGIFNGSWWMLIFPVLALLFLILPLLFWVRESNDARAS